jgi:hypothetical protein
MIGVLAYRQTGYMGDFCTGKVHVFHPGDKVDVENPTFIGRETPDEDIWLSQGKIVGTFTYPHPVVE